MNAEIYGRGSGKPEVTPTANGAARRTGTLAAARAFWLFAACLVSDSAWSISVSPISAELNLEKNRTHIISVVNNDKRPAPIKVEALTWALSPEGKDVREPTSDLVLFPGQFLLQPGERRSVRVAPRQKKKPISELSYRILVRELPIDLDGQTNQQSGVRLLTAYATAFYVTPENPRSDLQLTAVERTANGLQLKIINRGNAHTHLRQLRLLFSQTGKQKAFTEPDHMPRFYNENLLAASERWFDWQWPADVPESIDISQPFTLRIELTCESCEGGKTELNFQIP